MSFRPSQVRFIDEGWGQQDLEGEQPKGSEGLGRARHGAAQVDADKDAIQLTSIRMLKGEMKDSDKMK
jgi:hypothetical protein